PVDQPQVDVVEAERIEARDERRPFVPCATRRQLRRHEDLVARYAALCHRLPHLGFVAVHGRGVDVAIPDLERATDRVESATPARLPRAEPKEGHPAARYELDALVQDRSLLAHVSIR